MNIPFEILSRLGEDSIRHGRSPWQEARLQNDEAATNRVGMQLDRERGLGLLVCHLPEQHEVTHRR
jgi:hypothetical protein